MKEWLQRDVAIPTSVLKIGLLALFLASGFAGLIYQSIWSHYLALLLGHAAYAQALVLATFMGGMGLGAALVAQAGHRWRNLVRGYAVVEILLGIAGVGFHFAFVPIYDLTLEQILPLLSGGAVSDGVKWGIAATLVLPQSILLGASFPLLSAGLMRRIPHAQGRILGSLYFTNSMGAALGALCATFILLPLAGTPGALQVAGGINLLIGVIAWVLGSDPERAGARPMRRAPPPVDRTAAWGSPLTRAFLIAMLAATFLSSAASFVYEIAWIRMLSLAVGTTLHAFELMLAAFIGGIALGSLWIRRRIDGYREPMIPLAVVQLTMGLFALLSLAVYAAGAFEWVSALMEVLPRTDTGYRLYNVGIAVAAIVIMLPAAFFAGATLPLFTAVLLRSGRGEDMIGKVYACNTFGAILGVVVAIHLLIPLVGLRDAMIVAAGIDIAIGLGLFLLAPASTQRKVGMVTASVVGVLAIGASAALITFDPYRLASGVFRSGDVSLSREGDMLYYRDGKTASVSLFEWPDGTRSLAYNGKVDASIRFDTQRGPSTDEATNVLAAALPLGLHDGPERAAVVGMGSGLTSQTLLADERLALVETIEIEQRIVEAARGFGDRVSRVHEDARSHIVIDDARSVLVQGGEPYDIIVSIPSNPWVAGVGMLFADEFYRFIDQRLDENGIFVQWFQLYEIDEALVGSMLTALTPHFEHTQAWMANDSDMLIVARNGEPLPPLDTDRLFAGALGQELKLAGIDHPARIHMRKLAIDGMLPALARSLEQPPNSYYWPRLTLEAPRARYRGLRASALRELANQRSFALELLGAGAPLPAAVALGSDEVFRVERETYRARQLAELLEKGSTAPHDPVRVPLGLETELLRLWSGDCSALADDHRREAWISFHARTASRLLPLLDAESLRPLWGERPWLDCTDLPAHVVRGLDFMASAAERDLDAIPDRAASYLNVVQAASLPDNRLNELAYLAGQAALMASGRHLEADDFRNRYLGVANSGPAGELVQGILDRMRDADRDWR